MNFNMFIPMSLPSRLRYKIFPASQKTPLFTFPVNISTPRGNTVLTSVTFLECPLNEITPDVISSSSAMVLWKGGNVLVDPSWWPSVQRGSVSGVALVHTDRALGCSWKGTHPWSAVGCVLLQEEGLKQAPQIPAPSRWPQLPFYVTIDYQV